MGKLIDETGNVYGWLTVIERAGKNRYGSALWLCTCECGRQAVIFGGSLRAGRTRSCGCLQAELIGEASTTHGLHDAPEYAAWDAMKQRCNNPKMPNYAHYGGRGIKVCERWSSFENFYTDLGPRPTPEHSLDRIENHGDYNPENCRWATRKEQLRNTRRNHNITFQGKIQCVSAWAEEMGVDPSALFSRLGRGWSHERLLTEPVRSRDAG